MIKKTTKKRIFLIISLFFTISFISQTDLYAKSKPTIYVMGDSIAHSYVGNKQQNGWGQRLYQYFQYPSKMKMLHVKGASDYVDVVRYNTPKISIENWAKAGASVKIFDKYGLFESIQKKLKKDDYVFIQLGHNEVYTQWWTGSTVSEYKTYLINDIQKIQCKKANPVLITPPPVNTTEKYMPYVPEYRMAMMEVGKEYKIPVIDLGQKTADYFNLIGKKKAKGMYIKDNMHFTQEGAKTLAKIISVEIEQNRQLKSLSGDLRLKTKDLYKTIHKASKLKAEKYNKRKWRYMQKQLKKSKKILYSNAATQKSINSAKSDLKKSINKLRRK